MQKTKTLNDQEEVNMSEEKKKAQPVFWTIEGKQYDMNVNLQVALGFRENALKESIQVVEKADEAAS